MELAPTEALRLIEAGAVLLDVREDHEWAAGHAPDATHMAMGVLAAEHSSLPMDRTIVCVCLAGGRSALAADFLRQAGFDTRNLSGGMNAWAAAGLPVVDSSGGHGTIS